MGILEIEISVARPRQTIDEETSPIAITHDRLALSARPEFLAPADGPSGTVPNLWDRLSLSWRDPQLARDMAGG